MPSVKMNKVRKALSKPAGAFSIGSPGSSRADKKKRGSNRSLLSSDGRSLSGRSVSSASSWASSTADSQWDASSAHSASPSLNQSEGMSHKPLYPRLESKEVQDDASASCHSVSSSSSLPPLESQRPPSPPPPGSPTSAATPAMPRVPEDKEAVVAHPPPPIWVEDSVWSKRASSSSPVVSLSLPIGNGPAFAAPELPLPPPPQSSARNQRQRQQQQQQQRRRQLGREEDDPSPPPPLPPPAFPPPEQRPLSPSPVGSVPPRDPFAAGLAEAKERRKRAIRKQEARRRARAEAAEAAARSPPSVCGDVEALRPVVAVLLLVGALLSLSLLTSPSDGRAAGGDGGASSSSSTTGVPPLLDRLDDRLAVQSASKKYAIATSAKDWDALRTVLTRDVTMKYEEAPGARGMCVDYFDETGREIAKKRRRDDKTFLGGLFGDPTYREGLLEGVAFTSPDTAVSGGTIVRPVVVRNTALPFLGWYPGGSYRQEWMKDEHDRGEWKSFSWREDVSHGRLLRTFFARAIALLYLTIGAIALPAKLVFWRKQK